MFGEWFKLVLLNGLVEKFIKYSVYWGKDWLNLNRLVFQYWNRYWTGKRFGRFVLILHPDGHFHAVIHQCTSSIRVIRAAALKAQLTDLKSISWRAWCNGNVPATATAVLVQGKGCCNRRAYESRQSISQECIVDAIGGWCTTGSIHSAWEERHTSNLIVGAALPLMENNLPYTGKRDFENDSHFTKVSYVCLTGFSGVSLRRKRGKNGVIPSLSRSCNALACQSKG